MARMHVYNPSNSPVVYGDGQTIGGLEWHDIETRFAQPLVDAGVLISKSVPAPVVVEPEPEVIETPSSDDSFGEPLEVPSGLEDDTDDVESDDPQTEDETDTISKPRRRKPQPPSDKE